MSPEAADRRGPLTLFLIGFLTFALLYGAQPLLPALAHTFGVSAADSALALSVSTGALAVTIFLGAVRPSRRDRRHVMLAALLAAIVFNALSGLSATWGQLLACRALLGLFLGAVPATAMAFVGDTVPPARLAATMGLYVAGTALGGMTGRVAIGILSDLWGWRAGVLAVSGLGLAVLAPLAWSLSGLADRHATLAAKGASDSPWRRILRHPRLPRLFLCGGLASGIFVTAYNYTGFRLLAAPFGMSPGQIGLIFACYLFGVVSSSLSGGWVNRWGTVRVLYASCALTALGALVSLSDHLAVFVAGLALMTAGFFAMHAVCSGWVSKDAGAHKPQATGLYLLSYYVGSSVVGYTGGWLWGHGGWPWLCAGLLAGVAVFAGLVWSLDGAAAPSWGPGDGLARASDRAQEFPRAAGDQGQRRQD